MNKILVTGATGKIGARIVATLSELGIPSKAFSRGAAATTLPKLSQACAGDLTDIASLENALDGVDSVFLLWPFLSTEGAEEVVSAMGRHAKRIVYLSTAGAGNAAERAVNPISAIHYSIENMIENVVPQWTFVRPFGFASNTLLWSQQIRYGNTVRWPFGEAQRTLAHDGDIAEVIANALTKDALIGKRLTLTGPEVLSQRAQLAVIGSVIGKRLSFEEEAEAVAREQMLGWGMPASFVDGVLGYLAKCENNPEPVNNVIQEVTGRPPRSFENWVSENIEKFS